MARVYKHTSHKCFLGAATHPKMPRPKVLPVGKGQEVSQTESNPKMPRPKVLSAGKGHVASQNESRLPTIMELVRTLNRRLDETNRRLARRGNKVEVMVKEVRNNNQRPARLQQLQAQQSRLAVRADAFEDKKTCKSRQDFTPDGRWGDISSDRVHDGPMRLTSLSNQEYIEPPALPCGDDALVNQGAEAPMPCLSPVEIRKSTTAGSVLHAGSASTYKAQGSNFTPQLLPWSLRETIEEKNIGTTTRQIFAKYNRSWHLRVIETKSRQCLGFDRGG